MKQHIDYKVVVSGILIATYTILLYLLIARFDTVIINVNWFFSLFTPFIYGIIFSYILNLIMIAIETRILNHLTLNQRQKRAIAIFLSFIIITMLLAVILTFVVPQIVDSLMTFIAGLPIYLTQLINWVNQLLKQLDIDLTLQYINTLPWQTYLNNAVNFATQSLSNIFMTTWGTTIDITTMLFNLVMAISISVYMLSDKEKLIFQMKKIVIALFPSRTSQRFMNVSIMANQIIKKYLSGQLLGALVLGLLCFAGLLLLRIPYAILLSTIVAITALVPVIGPTIGNLICTFILLVVRPAYALIFFIYINVLQQIDNSFIYPKIVGESIGLSGLWVLMAILVGGKLFGIAGVVLGVPFMAVFYSITREFVHYLLQKRNIAESDIN